MKPQNIMPNESQMDANEPIIARNSSSAIKVEPKVYIKKLLTSITQTKE